MANDDARAVLARLAATIEARKAAAPGTSYVASLFAKGDDAILKKIGEEATEAVMAGKDGDKLKVVAEVADLWFHCLVLLARHGLGPDDVLAELARREGVSGHAEKAARETAPPDNRPRPAAGSTMHQDPNCIFCKIVRGEIPSRKVYEDADVLAFHDIHPVAPVHFMLVPKAHVASLYDVTDEHAAALGRIMTLAGRLAREQGASDGFRTIVNTGRVGRQDVPHVHVHVIGGPDPLGPMVLRKNA